MSRIGKKPVELPGGVEASVSGQTVSVKGPKGTRQFTATDDVSITDNTVLGNVGAAVQIGGAGAERVDFRNNVLAANGGFGLEAEPANFVGGALDHNLWFGNGAGDCSACVPGPSAVMADPLLDDVTPLPGSPCIDAGAITGVDRNGPLLGTASGAGADIGAVETP